MDLSAVNDKEIGVRLAKEEDRTYVERLFFLTDVMGDETRAISDNHLRDIGHYVHEWSPRIDGGVIAMSDYQVPVGGAWLRYFTGEKKGSAYMGAHDADPHDESQWATEFDPEDIPELCIALERRYAGLHVGDQILRNVCDLAQEQGAPAIALWVDEENPRALKLYKAHGFEFIDVPGQDSGPMIKYF